MRASLNPAPLTAVSTAIATRPRGASVALLVLALLLAVAGLAAGGAWGVLALCVGLPAALLGYGLELRRLWSSAGRT